MPRKCKTVKAASPPMAAPPPVPKSTKTAPAKRKRETMKPAPKGK